MLRWALIFFLISVVAGIFGFTDVAAATAGVAKMLFGFFLILCIIFLAAGTFIGSKIRDAFRGPRS
jgi:uncharacterized membrane protein YtjA (UPF0391 family)